MGLYVEVMCDAFVDGKDPTDPYELRALCWSHRGDNAQGATPGEARANARGAGWKVGPGNKAVCPGCRAALQSKDTQDD